jgi:4-aminobutyrate aminotransferase
MQNEEVSGLNSTAIDLISPAWLRFSSIVVERGKGAYLYDGDGNEYLDFTSGIAVTNTGHSHPRVVEAVQAQAARLLHGQINVILHPTLLRLVQALEEVTPPGLDRFFFSNSGAEAVEGAVKLARQATGRPNVIVFQGGFHGRTAMAMALTTSKTIYRAGYQPLPAGVFCAPYPYAFRYGWSPKEAEDFCIRELEYLLDTQTAPWETAAMLVEPILGEGGYVVPPKGFLQRVRAICDRHDILLIADEIQTGFGRTGAWFAVEQFGVIPDIITMAKGMSSGLPLSGIAARGDLMDSWTPGSHGGTFGANAVACAAAHATIQVIRDEDLLGNAQSMGARLLDGLHDLQRDQPSMIGDVRGLGLMVATEFVTEDGAPNPEAAKRVQKSCLEDRLLLLTCGTYSNVIRWMPPLVVQQEQIDQALSIYRSALQGVA